MEDSKHSLDDSVARRLGTCLDRALARAEEATARVHARAAIWTLAERDGPLHARQRAVLGRMLGEQGEFEGFLNS